MRRPRAVQRQHQRPAERLANVSMSAEPQAPTNTNMPPPVTSCDEAMLPLDTGRRRDNRRPWVTAHGGGWQRRARVGKRARHGAGRARPPPHGPARYGGMAASPQASGDPAGRRVYPGLRPTRHPGAIGRGLPLFLRCYQRAFRPRLGARDQVRRLSHARAYRRGQIKLLTRTGLDWSHRYRRALATFLVAHIQVGSLGV